MSNLCAKCGLEATMRNIFIDCNSQGCMAKIHDGCLRPEDGRTENGQFIWLCATHNVASNAQPRDNALHESMLRNVNELGNNGSISLFDTVTHNEEEVLIPNLLSNNEPAPSTSQPRPSNVLRNDNLQPHSANINATNTLVNENSNLRANVTNNQQNLNSGQYTRPPRNSFRPARNGNRRGFNRNPSQPVQEAVYFSSPHNNHGNTFIPRQSNYSPIQPNAYRNMNPNQMNYPSHQQFNPMLNMANRANNVVNNPPMFPSQANQMPNNYHPANIPTQQSYNPQNSTLGQQNLNDSYLVMMQKMSHKDLPEVTNNNISWSTFYETYKSTKHLFTDHENVVRIQKAIKDQEVLLIGGPNLLNIRTYDLAINKINNRLAKNVSFINKEASLLQAYTKIKAENYKKLSEYIDKIVNFYITATAYNEFSYINNKIFINGLAEKLPTYLHTKWINKQAAVEAQGMPLNLSHFVEVLELELPNINIRIQNSLLPAFDTDTKIRNERQRLNKTAAEEVEVPKSKFDGKLCWFHKSSYHPSHECRNLWEMSGDKVFELAKKNERCTICGQSKHNPCPYKAKLRCAVESCNENHHALYCHKRKAKKSKKESNHNTSIGTLDKAEEEFINHHESLHFEEDSSEEEADEEVSKAMVPSTSGTKQYVINTEEDVAQRMYKHENGILRSSKTSPVLLGVVVVRMENKKNVAFLVDSGSSVSVIEDSVAKELMPYGFDFPLHLRWTGEYQRNEDDSMLIRFKASKTHDHSKTFNLYFRTVINLGVCPQTLVVEEMKAKYPYLRDLELTDYDSIAGIIGIDNSDALEDQTISCPNRKSNMPIGKRCPLGDYVILNEYQLENTYQEFERKSQITCPTVNYNYSCQQSDDENNELRKVEKNALNLEEFATVENDRELYEDKIALDKMAKEIKRIEGTCQFEAPLLWKESKIELPTQDSYKVALRRYFIVEKNAIINNKFEEYEAQVKNLLDKNYAKELSYNDINLVTDKSFYIPVFFISPEGKRSRMIWDMAAKVDGRSLNDELMSGPNLYNDLLKINFQLAEHPYLVKGDLKEMFHQIRLKEEDTDALRFIFRFKNEEKIRTFKMLVLPFGAKCAPAISQYVKNLIAYENIKTKEIPSNIIIHSTYVDDVIKSFKDKNEAVEVFFDIKEILKTGGFSLLKINSNDKDLVIKLKTKIIKENTEEDKLFSMEMNEKLLGYDLDFNEDTISLAFKLSKLSNEMLEGKIIPTKRQVLKLLMSIFDPIGFCQFVISKLKLLYHKICIAKCDWDEEIPKVLFIEWKINLSFLSAISDIKIPRCYCSKNYAKVELWSFGDAGKDILCGVIYARFLDEDNKPLSVRLIYAKTFVVPEKQKRTIPELELQIALNLCQMVQVVVEWHEMKFDKIFYFTDNSAVYEWITNEPKKPTVYIKNRINKIKELSDTKCWNWIPTNFMPADYGTKETSMTEIKYENEWFQPKIFRLPEREWPSFKPPSKSVLNMHTDGDLEDRLDPKNVKNYLALIYAGQFFYRLKRAKEVNILREELAKVKIATKASPRNKDLRKHADELELKIKEETNKYLSSNYKFVDMENFIIKKAQEEAFKDELILLRQNKLLPKKNYYSRWLPWIDNNGIIRLKTRLNENEENLKLFGYDRIYPILLPNEHELTKLIILKAHRNNHHILSKNVENQLKSRFYIKHLSYKVSKVIKENCAFCKRYNARPNIPLMGDIPSQRLGYQIPPFSYTIADLAGPIMVKVSRNVTAKRYIFTYSCLTTRGIHLELIESLDTNATLIALQNTIHLRGAPIRIITDNGTNFLGAKNKMRETMNNWNLTLLSKGIITKPIEWEFGPARAPHMQGAVERMIGLVKMAMKKILTELRTRTEILNDFSLRAILMEVVGLLNNRPLSMAPMEDSCNEFLTPNNFLMLRSNFQEVPYAEENMKNIKQNWEAVRQFTKILWKNWLVGYLPTILEREKWTKSTEPLKEGDLVITVDTTVSNSWRMGKIVNIKVGSKNQVREVEVLLGKRNILDKNALKNLKSLKEAYKAERYTIVTRPAVAVAKIELSNN